MRKLVLLPCILVSTLALVLASSEHHYGFENGTPAIKSMHALTFGPNGILFIGDSKSATIFAIDTKDNAVVEKSEDISLEKVDELIAHSLGTTVDQIVIQDMAVNPATNKVYFAVHLLDGSPVLLQLDQMKLSHFSLNKVEFSKTMVANPIGDGAKDRRGRPLRKWAISDMDYFDGKLLVSGLSNQEFSSALSMIPFPFTDKQEQATLEIWHAAHGKFETHSPIKTFMATMINGAPTVIASYTCTPLVLFPLDLLKKGAHVHGRTVAELGNRNTPLDIISMEKGGKSYILMSNSSRALMKISYEKLESFGDSLTEPVKENSGTAGIEFINLPLVQVQQMDKYDDHRFLLLQRMSNGDLNLRTASADRWL